MPDSRITNLTPATQMTLNDLFVIEQAGLAKSISGQKILNKLANEYGGHGGIRSITYTEPVPPSTRGSMRITFTDEDYVVDVPVYNGEKGESGSAAYVHIRYASVRPTQDSDIRNTPDKWMGIYTGASRTAPTTYNSYVWYEIKGQNGEDGSTPTITVVGTDTLPAGSEASVTANTTPNGISLRFGIPRGYDGGGAGSVTSVGLEGGEGITVDGVSPIIGEGTFTVKHSNRIGAQSVQGVYPVTIDGNGHIKTYGSKATAADVGAAPEDHTHIPEDIGAAPADHTHSPEDIGAIADPSPKTNGQVLTYNGSSWIAANPTGGGSGFACDLLWTNPTTGSGATYPAKTEPVNGAGYKMYYVVFRQTANGGAYAMFLYPVGANFQLACISLGWGNTTQYKRAISSATETGITFTNGKTVANNSTSQSDNAAAMIPAYIYGIK